MIPLPYLYAGVFAAGLVAGGYSVHTWYKAQRVDSIEQAHETERAGVRIGNQAEVRHLERLVEQRDRAARNAANYRRALNETNRELDACRVSGAVVSVLDDAGVPPAARAPAGAGDAAAAAAAAPDSTCAVELDKCRANYADVCVPNAEQLRDLQGWYRDLRRRFNGGR